LTHARNLDTLCKSRPRRFTHGDCAQTLGRPSGDSLVSLPDPLRPPRVLAGRRPGRPQTWIEQRTQELAQIFAVAVGGFSVLDNHLHLLVRLDPDVARDWSDEEVVHRWDRLFPLRDKSRQALPVSKDWVVWRLKDATWVATARERLQSLSWFMKCLEEPLSRLANRQDQTRGAFFEGRFKSVAILDEESLLATCAYNDLNPVAAGIATVSQRVKPRPKLLL
jgi:REP element-mobilizing transposase RayT